MYSKSGWQTYHKDKIYKTAKKSRVMKHIHTFESFLNEAMVSGQAFGSKAAKFIAKIKEFDFFDEAAEKEDNGKLPEEWYAAIKTLGISEDDAIVCFYDSVGDANKVLDTAKLAGLKYTEVEGGEDGGSAGIVFSRKQ
jgi:hypothetical protein